MVAKESARPVAKAEEKTQPGVFKRWRRLAVSGLLGTSLMLSPVAGIATQLKNARGPPLHYSVLYEKDYADGWNHILNAEKLQEEGKNSKEHTEKAITYFESKYKEDQRIESLYMLAYSYYARSMDEKSFGGTEIYLKRAVSACEVALKKDAKSSMFIDLKLTVLQNTGQMYAEAFEKQNKEEYREKAIKYLNNFLSYYNESKSLFNEAYQKYYDELVTASEESLNRLNK